MVRGFRASVLALALPLAATPASAQVCHPAPAHHHHVTHVRKVAHRETGVGVVIDQARLVAFDAPVKTVFVGNPAIADISMLDSQHAFVLGKTFGVTNLIALAQDGKQISNQQVVVYNNAAAVTINRGADQYNYMCTHMPSIARRILARAIQQQLRDELRNPPRANTRASATASSGTNSTQPQQNQ